MQYIGREYIDMAVAKLDVLGKITDSGLVAIVRSDRDSTYLPGAGTIGEIV